MKEIGPVLLLNVTVLRLSWLTITPLIGCWPDGHPDAQFRNTGLKRVATLRAKVSPVLLLPEISVVAAERFRVGSSIVSPKTIEPLVIEMGMDAAWAI